MPAELRHKSLIERAMCARRWHRSEHGSLRHRLWDIVNLRHRWWDWGHPVMVLTGRENCGNYDPPRGRDMWYRPVSGKFVTTYDYRDLDKVKGGRANADWKIFDVQDDGHTVMMGYYPTGPEERIAFYGLDRREQALFLRWFLVECKLRGEWLGIRRWVYYKALHAAVERKIPFTCQVTPDRHSGGYTHWHCQLKKRHEGKHRFNNYTWIGEHFQVEYEPANA